MFKRVVLEEWQMVIPYICFALVSGVFLIIVIKAVRMKRSEIDRISSLPLKDDDELINSVDSKNGK